MHSATRGLRDSSFQSWPAYTLQQDDLVLQVVPSVGGRLMGMALAGQELCFTHLDLRGKSFDGDLRQWDALCAGWSFPLWGGGKTWIAPQSAWPDDAPHRDLDSLAWTVLGHWCDPQSMGIEVQSLVCAITGLQLSRRLVLPADARKCAVPQGIFGKTEGAMVRMIAYGPELNLAYPPRPTDPKVDWKPDWAVRLRLKSTSMAMLGQDAAASPARGGNKASSKADSSAPQSPSVPSASDVVKEIVNPVNVLKGLFGR